MTALNPQALADLQHDLSCARLEPMTGNQVVGAANAFADYLHGVGWRDLDDAKRDRALSDVLWSVPFTATTRHAMAAPTGSRRLAACPRGCELPTDIAAAWRRVCTAPTLRQRAAHLAGASLSADPCRARDQLNAARRLELGADAGAQATLAELRRAYLTAAVGRPSEGPKVVAVFNAMMDANPAERLARAVIRLIPRGVEILLADVTSPSCPPTDKWLARATACVGHLQRIAAADPDVRAYLLRPLQRAQAALADALKCAAAASGDARAGGPSRAGTHGGHREPGTALASADPPHAPAPASSPAPDKAAAPQAGPPCVAGRLDIRHVRDLAELVGLSPELHRYVAEARDRGQAAATASRPHQHLLLTGPSGCGKTYLAQVVAKALDMDLFLAGNLLRSTYSDGSALKLAAWLDQVEQRARGQQRLAYVLFDEAHVWLRQVDGHAPEDGKFVAFLLETLDGARAADYPHVVFMAATNYPDQLGPESRRRFVCADVGAPTAEQLSDHLRWCLRRRLGTQRTGPGSWLGDSGAAARLAHLGRYLLGLDRGDIARLVETLTPAAGLPNPEPLRQLIIDRRARAGALDGRHEKVGSTFDAAVRLPNITLADASPDRLAMFFGAGRPWSLQLLPSEPDTHGGLYLRCLQERAPTLGRIELTWAANPPAPTLVTAFSLDGRPGCGLWHVPLTQLREAGLAEAPGSRAFAERYERAHHGISVGLTVFVGHGGGSSAAGATRAVYDLGEARGLADGYETVTSGLAVRLSICRAPTPVSHDPVPDPVGGPGRVRAEVQLLRPGVVLRLLRDAHGWPGSATLYFGNDYLAGDTDCRLVARGGAANELGPLRVLRATLPAGETYLRLEPSAPRLLDLALARPGRDLPGAGRLGLLLGPVWPSDSDQQDREIDATLDWLATEFPNRAARPAQETGR